MRRRGRDFWFAVAMLAPVAAMPFALAVDRYVRGDRFSLPIPWLPD